MQYRTAWGWTAVVCAVGLFLLAADRGAAGGDDAPATAEPQPLHALLITGGCCHDYETQKKILTEGVSARAKVRWTIVHEGKDREHVASIYRRDDWAKGFDVVVHNECFGMVRDVAIVERIARAHEQGVPAVMLHCAAHSYREAQTDAWRQCLGITSRRHEKARPFEIEAVAGDHPVMKGFPATWRTPDADEVYIVEKVWPNVTPLATTHGVETKQDHVCIWTNTHGRGRVFGTTLGHHNAVMADEVYLDLVTRGLLWACDKLNEDGTPVRGYNARP